MREQWLDFLNFGSELCLANERESITLGLEFQDQDPPLGHIRGLHHPPRKQVLSIIEPEPTEAASSVFCPSFTLSVTTERSIKGDCLFSQEIRRAIGIALVKQCGWWADLRDPDLEIFVHLNDIHSVVGIPLFRLPLANRECIKTAGPSTIAWAMASLAEISAGAFVLDPLCGLGTILLEAAKEWPEACYWGADISDSQLEGADVNTRTAGLMDKIELLKASVKTCLYSAALPLPSESFDTVISDILFGKKFKITKDIQVLPDILQEMERVLVVGGTIVLLLSQDLHKRMDGVTKCAENDSPNAISHGASETPTAKALSIDGNSSSLVNGVEESFLSSRQTRFGSLVPGGVSLGKTNAFIYKYRKISTAGNR
ncbi:LOW QUALITY PROTEIN: U6 snRNA (guanine-N(2))-methyltransferase THUMPD2 [Sarcoramphus papa]